MITEKPNMNALEKATTLLGGASALARAIGVSESSPAMWKQRGRVPAEHCPLIEKVTSGAVVCEELRPDVAWDVLRRKPKKATA